MANKIPRRQIKIICSKTTKNCILQLDNPLISQVHFKHIENLHPYLKEKLRLTVIIMKPLTGIVHVINLKVVKKYSTRRITKIYFQLRFHRKTTNPTIEVFKWWFQINKWMLKKINKNKILLWIWLTPTIIILAHRKIV